MRLLDGPTVAALLEPAAVRAAVAEAFALHSRGEGRTFPVVREQLAAHPLYKDLRLVIIGDTISFQVRYEEISDGTTKIRWNRYEGKLAGAEIRLRILDDKGNPPVGITLTKDQTTP